MISDMWTIVTKDLKEILLSRGSLRSGLISIAIIVGLLGVYLPLQSGVEWFTNPVSLLVWQWMPAYLVVAVVTDSFAGERERHTLETLLASRLSDRAILFGKLSAAVLYGWGLGMIGTLLGVVTVNVAHPEASVKFYNPYIFLGAVIFGLLFSLLISSIGVLVSLRAPTARAAYQRISIAMLILFMSPTIAMQVIPAGTMQQIPRFFNNLQLLPLVMIGGGVLLALDMLFITLAMARFQRSKLILD